MPPFKAEQPGVCCSAGSSLTRLVHLGQHGAEDGVNIYQVFCLRLDGRDLGRRLLGYQIEVNT